MTDFMQARHRVAIAGRILDAVNGKPMMRARVEITAGPPKYTERLGRLADDRFLQGAKPKKLGATATRGDGLFFFLDLPEGDYKLVAFLPKGDLYTRPPGNARHNGSAGHNQEDSFAWKGDRRYGKAQFSVKVSYDPGGFDRLTVVRLQPTGIMGRVLASVNQNAVLMAEIRLKGSGERTFTNAQGQYTLVGMQPNARRQQTVQVRARGYRDQVMEVLIDEPGACKKLADIHLVRETGN
jgi:hypothetical protein